jgi:hypothetical protein
LCGVLLYLWEDTAALAVETMIRHTRRVAAILDLAHPEIDNACLIGSEQRKWDAKQIHNIDARVTRAGGKSSSANGLGIRVRTVFILSSALAARGKPPLQRRILRAQGASPIRSSIWFYDSEWRGPRRNTALLLSSVGLPKLRVHWHQIRLFAGAWLSIQLAPSTGRNCMALGLANRLLGFASASSFGARNG